LLLLTLVVGLVLGWWFDRRRVVKRNELLQLQVEQLKSFANDAQRSVGVIPAERFSRFATGGDFMEVLDPQVDWYEFQDELKYFAGSPAAKNTVPLLIEKLDDPSGEVRTRALASLGVFKQQPAKVIPAITTRLHDPFPNAAWHAANALGEFGAQARSARDALEAIFHDDKSSIAAHCGLMLAKVDPSIDIGPRLIELTQNPIRHNRLRAAQALPDHVKPDVARSVLTRLFETEQDKEIQYIIVFALNQRLETSK
jgi:HEAT repeat protein